MNFDVDQINRMDVDELKRYATLLEMEATVLDMKQMAAKVQLNSAYGALGNIHFRWYMLASAEAITSGGRLTTRWTNKKLNEWLNKTLKTTDFDYVIYADTDSVYLNLDPVVTARGMQDAPDSEICAFLDKFGKKVVEPFLDTIYDDLTNRMNAFENQMKMKREAIATRGIFVAPKRYVVNVLDNEGVHYAEPKLKITGLEAVRSSTPASVRDAIKKAMKLILTEGQEAYHDFVDVYREEFDHLPYNDIASNTGVNGMDKYYDPQFIYKKGTPAHVKASLLFNEYIKKNKYDKLVEPIREGDKVRYFPLLPNNPLCSDVLALKDDLPTEMMDLFSYLDFSAQFEKSFLSPMGKITNILGFPPRRTATLHSLFEY